MVNCNMIAGLTKMCRCGRMRPRGGLVFFYHGPWGRLAEEDKVQDGLAVRCKYSWLVSPLSTLNLPNVLWLLCRLAWCILPSQPAGLLLQQESQVVATTVGKSTHNHCGLLACLLPTCCPLYCPVVPPHVARSLPFFAPTSPQKASKKPAFSLSASTSASAQLRQEIFTLLSGILK